MLGQHVVEHVASKATLDYLKAVQK